MIPHKTDSSLETTSLVIPIVVASFFALMMLLCIFVGQRDRSAHSVFLFQSIMLFFITACTCLVNPVGKKKRVILFAAIWLPFVLASLFYGMYFVKNAMRCVGYCGSFYLFMAALSSFVEQRISRRLASIIPFALILFLLFIPITGNYILRISDDFLTQARTAELLVWANPFAVVSGIWNVDLMRWGWVYERSVIGSSYPYRIPEFLIPSIIMLAASLLLLLLNILLALFTEPGNAEDGAG